MTKRRVTLALQGGGTHGAFTWGVLDRLLDETTLDIQGISGTSAGAMNACALAHGFREGRKGAQKALDDFWRSISDIGAATFNPYQTTPLQSLNRAWNMDWSPASIWLDVMAQFVSPYQLNPLDRNPLRDLIHDQFDFDYLQRDEAIRLFVCATNLRNNKLRIFNNAELTVDAILASACLPQVHRAVEIEGEFYWDGGFVGNPVLKPLIRVCQASDVMIVQVNPMTRDSLPITTKDIMDRLNEVTMNATLMRELDSIATITRLVKEGVIKDERYRPIFFHRIADPEMMSELGVSSKNNTAWNFLTYLKDAGRLAADAWLAQNSKKIGKEGTLDLNDFVIQSM
ncbi:MAG: patatin-like phospholipase family protein [Geminicoccales bacterium]